MSTRRRFLYSFGFAFSICVLIAGQVEAGAQSVWQKMKQNVLQQQCQQGFQKACQALAQLNQKQPQQVPQGKPPVQQPGQPAQALPGREQQQANARGDDSGPVHPPHGTKVEETVMAPLAPGAKFFVSPHGVHIATWENSGSRAVIYYDGVPGPKFDEILGGDSSSPTMVAFSPDGKRYAYCGHLGNEFIVMVDGKELMRSSESWMGSFNGKSCALGFTSNSQHVFFSSAVAKSMSTGENFTRFFWDGKLAALPTESGTLASGETGGVHLSLSPDGNHYAYIAIDPANQQKWALVVDGKVAPYLGGEPQWSADSQHLYTVLRTTVPGRGQVAEAMLDGKPFMRANEIKLHVAPTGNMMVAEVYTASNTPQPLKFMVVNGKKVPGTELVNQGGANFDQLTFSPDGKHYAARFTNADGRQYVFADGKRGQNYQIVDHIAFTADSSKVTYTTFTNAKPYVVIGDQESDACSGMLTGPVIDPHGGLMIAASSGRAGTICGMTGGAPTIFMDGKTLHLPDGAQGADDLRFSPGGKHYAYNASFQGGGRRVVIDGVVQMNSNLGSGGEANGRHYVFSPDGEHIASYSAPPNPTGEYASGLFLDGKYIPGQAASYFQKLEFTADSKHVVWAQPAPGRKGFRIFVDGKAVTEADEAVSTNSPEAWWDMAPDGTLSILAQDEHNLKRITITPSPEISVATIGGGSALVAERNQ